MRAREPAKPIDVKGASRSQMPRGSISLQSPNWQVRLQMSDRAVSGNLALHADENVVYEAVGHERAIRFWKRGLRTEKRPTG